MLASRDNVRLIRAGRLEPKRVFRCDRCDAPPKKLRVRRRYLFEVQDEPGQRCTYCLPCAAMSLGVAQRDLRNAADSAPSPSLPQTT